jgi:hypothetical protein
MRLTVVALGLALSAGSAAGCAGRGPAGQPAPAASASSKPSAGPSGPAPDGRIDRATLTHAALTVPAWPQRSPSSCSTSDVHLAKIRADQTVPYLDKTVYGDPDGDGAQETIAILGCPQGETVYQQVVVFDRNAAGQIITLGQVVRMGGDIDWITDLRAGAPGSVDVQVADVQPCCETAPENAQRQWRTYGWDGSVFRQTGGPTKFGVNPLQSDLQLTVGGITFAQAAGDQSWHGTITVTIHNGGPGRANQVRVNLTFGKGTVRHEGSAWSACTHIFEEKYDTGRGAIQFDLVKPLGVGQSTTLVLGVASNQQMTGTGDAKVATYLRDGPYMIDPVPVDNQVTFTIH